MAKTKIDEKWDLSLEENVRMHPTKLSAWEKISSKSPETVFQSMNVSEKDFFGVQSMSIK